MFWLSLSLPAEGGRALWDCNLPLHWRQDFCFTSNQRNLCFAALWLYPCKCRSLGESLPHSLSVKVRKVRWVWRFRLRPGLAHGSATDLALGESFHLRASVPHLLQGVNNLSFALSFCHLCLHYPFLGAVAVSYSMSSAQHIGVPSLVPLGITAI